MGWTPSGELVSQGTNDVIERVDESKRPSDCDSVAMLDTGV